MVGLSICQLGGDFLFGENPVWQKFCQQKTHFTKSSFTRCLPPSNTFFGGIGEYYLLNIGSYIFRTFRSCKMFSKVGLVNRRPTLPNPHSYLPSSLDVCYPPMNYQITKSPFSFDCNALDACRPPPSYTFIVGLPKKYTEAMKLRAIIKQGRLEGYKCAGFIHYQAAFLYFQRLFLLQCTLSYF